MSIISNICSQYWMFPSSVLTIILTGTVIKKNGKMSCLEGAKDRWRVPLLRVSGTVLSLGNLMPEFLLSRVLFPPHLLPQNNHFPKSAAHLPAPELKFS